MAEIIIVLPAHVFLSFKLSSTLGLGVKFLTGTPKLDNIILHLHSAF